MLTWAHWTTQLYQNHNITNIQQATWYRQQNRVQYIQYSACIINQPTSAPDKPVNNFSYSASVPNCNRTHPYHPTVKPFTSSYSTANEQKKTNIMMEADSSYIITRYNYYAVHFQNKTALSVEEIQEICGAFCEMKSCKQTGPETGLVFINFETEDAAKQCVEGLRNHPVIKLRPAELYKPIRSNNRNDNSYDSSKNYHNPPSKKYNYPPSSSSSGLNNSLDRHNNNEQLMKNDNSRQGSENSYHTVEENEPKKMMSDQFSINNEQNYSTPTINNGDNANDSKLVAADNELDIEKLSLDEHDSVPTNLPELIPAKKKFTSKNIISRDVPKFTMDVPKKQPVEVIEAQEVIVANIEENYGVPAVLHLLEKYDPICASPIQMCESHSVRYCHVYFANIHDAEAAERELDEYEWFGNKKLIVLRVNTLATLASRAKMYL